MRTVHVMVAAGVVAVGGLPGAATAGASDPAAKVEIVDKEFTPREVMVKAGGSVTWHHADGEMAHTVTADDNTFDSHPACPSGACMQRDDRFTWVFPRPGKYPYHCKVHAINGMVGTVIVE